MRFRLNCVLAILVFAVLLGFSHQAHSVPPSKILEFRNANEKLSIGLGLAETGVGVLAADGIRIKTADDDHIIESTELLKITFGTPPPVFYGAAAVWRIQILATGQGQAAMRLKDEIEKVHQLPAYVVHAEPWFKVQVGSAPTAEDAEVLREKLIEWGYEGAWVVRGEEAVPNDNSSKTGSAHQDTTLPLGFVIKDGTGNILATLENQELILEPMGKSPLILTMEGISGRAYRGNLRLRATGEGKFQVINTVDIEQYLYGVVGAELYSDSLEDEAALAAQAIAARTYGIKNLGKHAAEGFDLCAVEHCQAYRGIERESDAIKAAVDMTKGKILVYGGQVISAVYHSNSGGTTIGAEEAWAGRYTGYLRPIVDEIQDPADETIVKLGHERPGAAWEVEWEGKVLDSLLRKYLKSELGVQVPAQAALVDIQLDRQPSGRVAELNIVYRDDEDQGQKLAYAVSKDRIRWVLRKPDHLILPSTSFSLEIERLDQSLGKVKARGEGNGHGVGLAQAGAIHMSRLNFGYEEILAHYYTDVMIVELPQYYKEVELKHIWEQKGFTESWVTILGPNQGVENLTKVFRLSPRGDVIAYSIDGEGGGLWVFNVFDGKQTRLTDEPALEVAWKHDGSALAAAVSSRTHGKELWVISFENDEVAKVRLAQGPDIHGISWLSGGDLVIFGQNNMIYGGLGGLSIPVLTEAKTPHASPGGKQIAFWQKGSVWVYRLDTGLFRRVCDTSDIKALLWSPDGRYLAIEAGEQIQIRDIETGSIITELAGVGPCWSPDGRSLAYVQQSEGGLSGMYIVDLSSLDEELLVSSKHQAGAIHWSAQGKIIAHNADGDLHIFAWH